MDMCVCACACVCTECWVGWRDFLCIDRNSTGWGWGGEQRSACVGLGCGFVFTDSDFFLLVSCLFFR